jgi:hypothetical protein
MPFNLKLVGSKATNRQPSENNVGKTVPVSVKCVTAKTGEWLRIKLFGAYEWLSLNVVANGESGEGVARSTSIAFCNPST